MISIIVTIEELLKLRALGKFIGQGDPVIRICASCRGQEQNRIALEAHRFKVGFDVCMTCEALAAALDVEPSQLARK